MTAFARLWPGLKFSKAKAIGSGPGFLHHDPDIHSHPHIYTSPIHMLHSMTSHMDTLPSAHVMAHPVPPTHLPIPPSSGGGCWVGMVDNGVMRRVSVQERWGIDMAIEVVREAGMYTGEMPRQALE